ncbi:MAG: ABC transporter ATP-binding protein [Armatimonadetes bacterium]|nr:ABC transporter ATP-binding protein [Armatimonadota bacterium]
MSQLVLRGLSKEYVRHAGFLRRPTARLRAVDDISLAVSAGETLGLVGESGSGKTTIGKLALRLIPATAGEILFEDRPLHGLSESALRPLRARMSMIFQDPYASLNPRKRIGAIVGRPLQIHQRPTPAALRRAVHELLDRVGLAPPDEAARKFPHQLSGGQRQRVAIARAIATRPRLIVADEPVSALDVSVRAQILNLMRELQREMNAAVLFISHDLSIVHAVSDRVAVLYRGQVVEQGPASEVFLRPVHPYTQLLVASTPELLRRAGFDAAADAEPGGTLGSSAADDGSACRFAVRCPYAFDRCRVAPPLIPVVGGHEARCVLLQEPNPPSAWRHARAWTGTNGPAIVVGQTSNETARGTS